MNFRSSFRRGFTLIELLVVIAIIGLLAAVVLVSLNAARGKSRDSTRIQAVEQMRNALEIYRTSNNGKYPTTGGKDPGNLTALSTALIPTYISKIPGPTTDTPHYISDGNDYIYYVDTENPVTNGSLHYTGTVSNSSSGGSAQYVAMAGTPQGETNANAGGNWAVTGGIPGSGNTGGGNPPPPASIVVSLSKNGGALSSNPLSIIADDLNFDQGYVSPSDPTGVHFAVGWSAPGATACTLTDSAGNINTGGGPTGSIVFSDNIEGYDSVQVSCSAGSTSGSNTVTFNFPTQ